jgi:hypothetical protein
MTVAVASRAGTVTASRRMAASGGGRRRFREVTSLCPDYDMSGVHIFIGGAVGKVLARQESSVHTFLVGKCERERKDERF